MNYIYLDVLMITNFCLTYMTVKATQLVTHSRLKLGRGIAASCVGAAASLLIVFESTTALSAIVIFAVKLAAVALTVGIAFRLKTMRERLRYCVVYVVVACVFAAVTLAFWRLTGSRIVYIRNFTIYFNISILTLIVSTIAAYALIVVYGLITGRKLTAENSFRAKLTDVLSGNETLLPAVADTGNALCDVFSGKPVVICTSDTVFAHYHDLSALRGFRLIPCATVGGTGLIAVTTQLTAEITDKHGKTKTPDAIVGIVPSGGGGVKADFSPANFDIAKGEPP
ncbi:MAG: sigma-E processing peptidase SpoIIGA [Oscillospiraceae bacterium]